MQPTDEIMEKILDKAKEITRDTPRCPLCRSELLLRKAELICPLCNRVIEGCCGQ